ncbi:GNAT family N-acetyltransferase [Microlunatus sp. Gsoil 973]|jgi:phosphinothricin acetyltransferase|uniref:GNAT family N-acetyltransferase n=1 Tax=Microlunatus sp. Gsoil 973 TaxID=2672569 RepID=UPI0012B4E44D|nr:GNAT family N-acetyltransferase [Microlunatus sp. Gsoil 973]QGN35069.1 GNAT family N-acetyltransferase [Microlunatus sp. Gsoil 973]
MITVRPMTDADAQAVLAIYRIGIDEGDATFETGPPGWDEFLASKIAALSRVAVDADGTVVGWIAASPVSARACYAGVAEHSVYVHPRARGRGVGSRLLAELITAADAAGIWTIQSSIFPENRASLRLHAAAGFRVVGRRERIARHHGRWRDTVLIEYRRPDDPADHPGVGTAVEAVGDAAR